MKPHFLNVLTLSRPYSKCVWGGGGAEVSREIFFQHTSLSFYFIVFCLKVLKTVIRDTIVNYIKNAKPMLKQNAACSLKIDSRSSVFYNVEKIAAICRRRKKAYYWFCG